VSHDPAIKNQRGEKMKLDDLTIAEVKQINSLLKGGDSTQSPYNIGKNYFIRTVTHYLTGKLLRVTAKELVLKDAAWIADTGRFMQAIRDGKLNEVEPYPDNQELIVGRGSIIDAVEWTHVLPREQK
jgi:hypothetical protein